MRKQETKKLALCALLTGVVTAATMLSIPVPGFRLYFNLGEAMIYTIAITLGARYGAFTGGIGASIADLILGYPLWAPATLIIKSIEGYIVGKVAPKNRMLALLSGAAVMTLCYSTLAGVLYGWNAAPVEALTDITQTGIGMLVAIPLSNILNKRISTGLEKGL